MIRQVKLSDAPEIMDIYNYYIEETAWTQEYDPIDLQTQEERIKNTSSSYLYLVHEEDGKILGYAYASQFRWKVGYRFTAESTIYIHPDHLKKNIGTPLYTEVLGMCQQQGFHRIIGGLTLPNDPSARFHEKLGFKKVGEFTDCAYKFSAWHDIGFWELAL